MSIFYIVLFLSLLLNVIFILPYWRDIINTIYTHYFIKPFYASNVSDTEIIESVVYASQHMGKVQMKQDEHRGLLKDIEAFFHKGRNSEYQNNFYTAYLYVGLSQFMLTQRDKSILAFLERKASMWADTNKGCLTYGIQRIDQIPIGIVFVNLYHITKDMRYLKIAKYIYHQLLLLCIDKNGFIKYNTEIDKEYVDALGMSIPFLMEYYLATGDISAYDKACANIMNFYRHGVDKETGIPAHGYNKSVGIRIGSANWGRGIGWYLLARAYCPIKIEGDKINETIGKLTYSQFPCSSDGVDTSAALMFEIYKQYLNPNRQLSLDFIKPYIRKNGIIDGCSGDTYGYNFYSAVSGQSEFCNGLFLLLVSKFSNTERQS